MQDITTIFQLSIFFIKFMKDGVGALKDSITIHLSEFLFLFKLNIFKKLIYFV